MALYCVVSYPSSVIGDILLFLDRLTSVDPIANELAQKKSLRLVNFHIFMSDMEYESNTFLRIVPS